MSRSSQFIGSCKKDFVDEGEGRTIFGYSQQAPLPCFSASIFQCFRQSFDGTSGSFRMLDIDGIGWRIGQTGGSIPIQRESIEIHPSIES